MTAYFATRQWVAAAAGWLGDPALWAKARAYSKQVAALNQDINDGLISVSRNTGRWYGEGGPCEFDATWELDLTCGTGVGYGGTVLGARSAIKDYHGDHDPTIYRKLFETLMPGLAKEPEGVTDAMAPIASSRPIREVTKFVRLRVTNVKGIELEDPIPYDGADLYAKAMIAGQSYLSAVIDDHDSFNFPKPYAPFTFIKAVPVDGRYPTPISRITVKIHTGDRRWAGTNDDVFLELAPGLRFPLDKSAWDDFERGDNETYSVPIDVAAKASLNRGDLQYVRIQKSSDGAGGGWNLAGVTVVVDGATIADQQNMNVWLEDNHRVWTTSIARDHRTVTGMPIWLNLYDEDGFLYGGDDAGDVNPDDNRDAIVRAYSPGAPGALDVTTSTGGYALGGRIGKGGDTAKVTFTLDTLVPKIGLGFPYVIPAGAEVAVGLAPPADPPPVATTPTTPPTTPTTPPTTPAKPDLVLSSLTHFKFTVGNQGTAAAGPFSVTVTGFPPVRIPDGLNPGRSVTMTYGDKCQVTNHAVVDSLFEVTESDETNNVLDYNSGC